MTREKLEEILTRRISEFGEKPAYVLTPEELQAGKEYGLLVTLEPEDRGDGTVITKAFFAGKKFLCVTEKE